MHFTSPPTTHLKDNGDFIEASNALWDVNWVTVYLHRSLFVARRRMIEGM